MEDESWRGDADAVQALVRAYVACEVALEALPHLPEDLREPVRAPIAELCRIVRPALEAIEPASTSRRRSR